MLCTPCTGAMPHLLNAVYTASQGTAITPDPAAAPASAQPPCPARPPALTGLGQLLDVQHEGQVRQWVQQLHQVSVQGVAAQGHRVGCVASCVDHHPHVPPGGPGMARHLPHDVPQSKAGQVTGEQEQGATEQGRAGNAGARASSRLGEARGQRHSEGLAAPKQSGCELMIFCAWQTQGLSLPCCPTWCFIMSNTPWVKPRTAAKCTGVLPPSSRKPSSVL